MEITTMQMYWLVKLDDIRAFLDYSFNLPMFIITLGLAWVLILTMTYLLAGNGTYDMFSGKSNEEFEDIRKMLLRWRNTSLKIISACIGIAIAISTASHLMPSTKQMAAIIIVPKIANSEKVQTIGNKVYDLAVEWMEELKPNKKESEVK